MLMLGRGIRRVLGAFWTDGVASCFHTCTHENTYTPYYTPTYIGSIFKAVLLGIKSRALCIAENTVPLTLIPRPQTSILYTTTVEIIDGLVIFMSYCYEVCTPSLYCESIGFSVHWASWPDNEGSELITLENVLCVWSAFALSSLAVYSSALALTSCLNRVSSQPDMDEVFSRFSGRMNPALV